MNPLVGTWKLRSHVVTTASGARSAPYGENPSGYLSYSADGRMQVIGTANPRRMPGGGSLMENERAALYETMFAYAGTYSLKGNVVVHHVDISWNETWTGTDQVRHFELTGNLLILTTRIPDPASGALTHYAVTWEKIG